MLFNRRKAFICVVVVVFLLTRLPFTSAPTLVDLGYARYQGVQSRALGVTSFYGLHYAAPPVGDLRWQPPVPIGKAGIYKGNLLLDATTPGTICHQSKPTWQKSSFAHQNHATKSHDKRAAAIQTTRQQSEDCLQLDVMTPSKPSSKSLPVVVFIHGGGYVKGYAAQYDGQNFVSFSKGSVIWVQIHYRLGLFGFLGGKEVNDSGSSNVGLLDQELALQWVQNNIAKFGGDPQRVTVWGGSAGGAAVLSQLILHRDRPAPPFRAAIVEYPWWQPHHSDDVLQAQYGDLITSTGCDGIACLRRLSEATLVKSQQKVYDKGWEAHRYGYGDFYFGPSVDGKIVPALPQLSLEAGNFVKVPMLIDRAGFEGFNFTSKFITQDFVIQTYLKQLWPQTDSRFYEDLFKLYPAEDFSGEYFDDAIFEYFASVDSRSKDNSAFFRTQTIFSDATINCPTRSIAKAFVKAGQDVWKMQFRKGNQMHATVTKEYLLSADSSYATRQLRSYFLAFITSMNPNGPARLNRPLWPIYSSDDQILLVNEHDISTASDSDAGQQCEFFATNHAMVGY